MKKLLLLFSFSFVYSILSEQKKSKIKNIVLVAKSQMIPTGRKTFINVGVGADTQLEAAIKDNCKTKR